MTTTDDPLTRFAIDAADVREEEEARALATLAGLEFADLGAHPVTESTAERLAAVLPEAIARQACLAAVGWRDDTPVVAISAPESVLTIDDLARSLGRELIPVVACRSQIEQLLEMLYPPGRAPEITSPASVRDQPPGAGTDTKTTNGKLPASNGATATTATAPVAGAEGPGHGGGGEVAIFPPGAAEASATGARRSAADPEPAAPLVEISRGATPDGATPSGATPGGATPGGATPDGATADGATPDGAVTAPQPPLGEVGESLRGEAGTSLRPPPPPPPPPPAPPDGPAPPPPALVAPLAEPTARDGAGQARDTTPTGGGERAADEVLVGGQEGTALLALAGASGAPPGSARLSTDELLAATTTDLAEVGETTPEAALLQESALLSQTDLQRALREQRASGRPLLDVALGLGLLDAHAHARAGAALAGLEFVELEGFAIDLTAVDVLPEAFARRRGVAAVGWLDDVPIVATGAPGDVVLRDDVRSAAGREVHFVGADPQQVAGYNDRLFSGRTAPSGLADVPLTPGLTAGTAPQATAPSGGREGAGAAPAPEVASPVGTNGVAGAMGEPARGPVSSAASLAETGLGERGASTSRPTSSLRGTSPAPAGTAGSPVAGALPASGWGPKPGPSTGATAPPPPARSLDQILLRDGKISEHQAQSAVEERARTGRSLREIFNERRHVSTPELYQAVAEEAGLEYVDLNEWPIDQRAAELVPEALARRYRLLAIGFTDVGQAIVGMANPSDVFAIDDLRTVLGREVEIVVCSPLQIDEYIPRLYRQTREVDRIIRSAALATEPSSAPEARNLSILAAVEDGPIVQFVNTVLRQALQQRASDVHIEPTADDMIVRFRIDGVMHHVTSTPKAIQGGVTTRLKVMADLDIAEHRVPQDGRISVNVGDRDIDLRVATLPTVHGEMVALRILDKSSSTLDLANLGFDSDVLDAFRSAYRKPYGTVLVTGPTGSGKSTTLYATLNQLNQPDRKLITIEDPVEYQIRGINQIQVNPRAGLTFASALRSILRSDPDVILVGEIRDKETATIAIEAALTGHLVLSSLHTNDAAGTPMRLVEMGVEPFLVGSALDCVVGQRLARVLCTVCSEAYRPTKDDLAAAGWDESDAPGDAEPAFRHAVGCQACSRTGYRGRIAIQEVMLLTEEIERAVVTHAQTIEIQRIAEEQGMRTLRHDGLRKASRGLTSLEEILRVVV